MTTAEKHNALAQIAKEVSQCKICQQGKSGVAVPGEGNPNAAVVFMGEAPGKQEAMSGRPFIGRSGKLLRSLIQKAGLHEENVFITSPVKYLPDRGTPTKKDIEHGMLHTQKQLDIINPKIIVLLGNSAAQGVFGEKIPVMKKHGEIIEKQGKKFVVTFHPSAALRFPKIKAMLEKDFEKLPFSDETPRLVDL